MLCYLITRFVHAMPHTKTAGSNAASAGAATAGRNKSAFSGLAQADAVRFASDAGQARLAAPAGPARDSPHHAACEGRWRRCRNGRGATAATGRVGSGRVGTGGLARADDAQAGGTSPTRSAGGGPLGPRPTASRTTALDDAT